MVKLSELTIDKRLTNNKIAIFNSFTQAIANTGDLDKNYISNNGLLANIFTYQVSQNNEYLDFIKKNENNYIEFFLKIMNLPQLVEILKINIQNSNLNLEIDSNLDKSVFNNIPVFAQLIETVGSLNNEDIQKYYESIISKDTQGNYPSLIISLLMEQVEKILENNLVQSYYQNSIPILSLYGEISPKILYQKYIYDTTRSIQSYILNFGPSTLDSISAIFNFYKLNEIRKLNSSNFTTINYQNNNSFFTNYLSNNSNINQITDYYPNGFYSAYGDNINSTFIANFNNYSPEYNIDLSQKYLFYLGIDNDYGWNNATKFLKSIASEYTEIILESYSSENGNVIYRINNDAITQQEYNEYIENNYINDVLTRLITNQNINFQESQFKSLNINNQDLNYLSQISKNPKVIAIKFPYYQTENDENNEDMGLGVQDAWYILDKIVTNNNLSINDITIILQSYGTNSDKETLKFLMNNTKYIPLTIGSIYDFLEKNFNDLFNENSSLQKNIFDGLMSVKSYNAFNTKFINKLSKTLYLLKDYIKYDTIFSNFEEYFDQFNFYKLLVLLNNIGLYITNTTRQVGINSNEESLVTNIKIPSGKEIFDSNYEFNFKELSTSQSAGDNGISDSKYLFSGLINTAYNYGNYLSVNDGSPFNRNCAYTIYQRNSNGPYQDFANIKIKYNYVPMYYTNIDNNYEVAFINSDIDLVTSLIFDINGDTTNYNLFYKQNLLNYLNNSILVTNDNSYISVPTTSSVLYSSNIEDILIKNDLSYNEIKQIIIGNKIQNIQYNTDNFSLNKFTDLSSIIFGNSLLTINDSLLKDSSINSINFIIDSSSNYDNCLNTIESNAFSNCVNLNNVILPNNVYIIGNNSFEKTTNLKNFTFSKNLQTIGTNAFFESGIETVYFSSINDICNNAFNNCNNLLNVTFDISCKITILNNNIFANCISLNSVTLCDSISKISNCFNNCESLQNINLSKSITEIEANCFTNCINLENINIEDSSLTILNDNLFTNCSKLKRCILPVSITNIGNNVFNNCIDLSYLIINGAIENDLCNNLFSNIGHKVIIYYFSNLTATSKFNNVLNDVSLVDLYNTIPQYNLIDYFENINVEINSIFKLKNINIEFFIEDYKINYDNLIIENSNDLDCSLNVEYISLEQNNFSNRNISIENGKENGTNTLFKFINSGTIIQYIITFGNNLTLIIDTFINLVNNISNKPNINYKGNKIQYISDYSKDLNFYGVNSKNNSNIDISYISLTNSINPTEFENNGSITLTNSGYKNNFDFFTVYIKFYINYYYAIDENNNYNCDYNYICYLQENVSKRNLRINNQTCKFEFINENNINKGKLTLRFENDGNISVNNQLKLQSTYDNVLDINYTKFLFPIFSITDNSGESNNLTNINGPPSNISFNLGSNGPNYYFKNRIDSKILNGTIMNILNSYNNYQKVYKQINFQSEYVYEQAWGLTKGLKANDYISIEIIFNYFGNCKDILNNKNNIFTKNNNFAIFLDNGTTSSFSNNILKFYNVGYFNETFGGGLNLRTSDLFNLSLSENYNYNDNVFNFEISGNVSNLILNGPSNLIIERGSYFEDFGVMYIGSISNEQFKYYEYPENTYNSISLELLTGVYEISYVVYPFGESGISYQLSRTIQVVDSNSNKPTITLGNNIYQEFIFNIFESSQNIYSLNNLMNYAYDSSGKELPIFNKLLTNPLNNPGNYYEYFYTYDDFGNYNSVKRTIKLTSIINIDNQTNYELSNNILDIYIKNNSYENSNIYIVFKQLQTYESSGFDISFGYNGITYYTSNDALTNYDLGNIEISGNSTITPEVSNNYLILDNLIEPSSNNLISINNLDTIYKQVGLFLVESSQNVIDFNNIDFNNINSSNSFVYTPFIEYTNLILDSSSNFQIIYDTSNSKLDIYIENSGTMIYNNFDKKIVFKKLHKYNASSDYSTTFSYEGLIYYTSNNTESDYNISNASIISDYNAEISNNSIIINNTIEPFVTKVLSLIDINRINQPIGLFLIDNSENNIDFNNINSFNSFVYIGNNVYFDYNEMSYNNVTNILSISVKSETYLNTMFETGTSNSSYLVCGIYEISNNFNSTIYNFNYENYNLGIIQGVNTNNTTSNIISHNINNVSMFSYNENIFINVQNIYQNNLKQYINFEINNLILDNSKVYALFIDKNVNTQSYTDDDFANNYGFIYENNELFTNNSDNIYIINQHLLN